MKTFDEAFEIVNRNQEMLDADLDAFGHEGLRNDAFVTLVIRLCDHWMSRLQTVEEDKCAAFTCSFIQAVFNLGLKVGMEMEK